MLRDVLSSTTLANLEWTNWAQPDRAGSEIHTLFTEEGHAGATAFLTRFAAGAHGDLHEHLGHELMLVLAGELLEDDGGRLTTGDLMIKEPGSIHRVRSVAGCTVLGIRTGPTRAVAPKVDTNSADLRGAGFAQTATGD
ncbi:cupin domain-containing protein [Frankia sp. AiPs1]|uniref:cupin domain-containing protein n=1 Tax=Frankia sp. AiPs1 TaxID=573493 RepID=UPI002042EB0A|nr:cupin domain-containing protein [Frankia sp. AiPs1]MCM3920530.1 cupin domain-containing protein [Frankia sp. AiPs1]